MALTVRDFTKKSQIVVDFENYGRNLEGIDVSRTIGWFTSIYPVVFKIEGDDLDKHIKAVKEQIRKVPKNGIGYGIAKYLAGSFNQSEKLKSEIRFNYLGQFGEEVSNDLFSYSNKFSGKDVSDENHITSSLEINILIINKELNVEFVYCNVTFNESDIISLKEGFIRQINNLVFYLKNSEDIYFTPSDFNGVELEDDDLKVLFQ